MLVYEATCDQIEKWLEEFRRNNNPEDLIVLSRPRIFLSCRFEGFMAGKAYACYGDRLADEINSSEDVYSIAEENCT